MDPCDLRLTSLTGQVIPMRGEALVPSRRRVDPRPVCDWW